jgi:hypothetical protein
LPSCVSSCCATGFDSISVGWIETWLCCRRIVALLLLPHPWLALPALILVLLGGDLLGVL